VEEIIIQQKNQKLVKVLSWVLIVLSALVLIRSVFTLQSLSTVVTIKGITKNFNPPVELNFAPFIIQSAIEILLCVVIFVSATYVLKFRKVWKQILIYSLIASIIFLIVSPLINYFNPTFLKVDGFNSAEKEMMNIVKGARLMWSYTWSILFSIFFVYVILKLSREEIKILFK
jgi:hypothetical protein